MSWCRAIKLIVLAVAFSSCGHPRPEVADAKAEFAKRYPAAEIVGIREREDEVIARSFEITYRRNSEQQTKVLNFQYMKNAKGVYELQPPPPPELP